MKHREDWDGLYRSLFDLQAEVKGGRKEDDNSGSGPFYDLIGVIAFGTSGVPPDYRDTVEGLTFGVGPAPRWKLLYWGSKASSGGWAPIPEPSSRSMGNADDADEVVQDVFLQAYQYESRNDVANGVGLLKRLAVCRSLDRLRHRRAESDLADVAMIDRDSGPQEHAIGNEIEARLRTSVGQLPEREAEVFCLRYFDELTNQQIAEALGLTTEAVATAMHQARTKLAAMLADLNEGVA